MPTQQHNYGWKHVQEQVQIGAQIFNSTVVRLGTVSSLILPGWKT